jgi:two-component system, NarL family, sensor kinase
MITRNNFLLINLSLAFLLLAFSPIAPAQNLDSLENSLKSKTLPDTEKLKLFDNLSWGYLSSDFDKSKHYALEGISLAGKLKDQNMTGTLFRNLGVAYYMVSKYDSALIHLNKALDLATKTGNNLLKAQVYGAKANLYNVTGDYPKALELYIKALPIFEKEGRKDRVRVILGNIGSLNNAMQNFDEAEKYFRQSLKLSEELGDKAGIAQAYDGLNRIYIQRKDYKKALEYAVKAVDISHEIGNKQEEAIAIQGIAWVYYEHYKDYKKAEEFALKGLKLAEELEFPADIAAMLNTLSNIYFHQARYRECEETALKAIAIDTSDMNIFSNLAANVVRAGIHLGDTKQALYYFDRYRQIFNIQSNKEYQQALMDMQVKYETEKKQKEILKLSAEKRERNILIYSLLGFFLIISGLGFSIYNNVRKNKIIVEQQLLVKEKQLAELEKERQLIATKSVLKGEESERSRMARDLHDGLGGMLSGVKINLSAMKGNSIITSENAQAFDHAIKLLDTSISELRRVAHNLMPETLNHYGLKTALNDFIAEMNNNPATVLTFNFFGADIRFESQLELTAFRIAQELVNNALKHSGSAKINIQLIADVDRICIQVVDDGKGFDTSSKSRDGKGLVSIHDRVAANNGSFEIESAPGKGTEATVEFLLS